jgi:hypothetical protein
MSAFSRRGYGVLELTHEAARCEIYHVATIDKKDDKESLAAVVVSEAGNNRVTTEMESGSPSPSAVNF